MSAPGCTFDWCENGQPDHKEHTWTGCVVVSPMQQPRRAYVWTSVQEGYTEPVLVGIEDTEDESSGSEIWLTLSDAEDLRDTLTAAIEHAREGRQQ